jgi:hypothetical protein
MAANNVTVRMSAEEAGLVQKWMEATKGVQAFSQELDRAGQKGQRAGKTIQQEMGAMVSSNLLAAVSATVLFKAGIDKMSEAWTEYIKVQEEAARGMRAVVNASAKLSQLASSPKELQQLHEKRDTLAAKYNISQDAAVEAMFNARSAGLDDSELDMLAKGSILGDDSAKSSAFMGSIKQIYKGSVDPKQAYNVALQAAADSPNLEMADYTEKLPMLMAPGDKLGLGIEELASMMTEGSATFGKVTGDRYQELLGRLGTFEQYQGKGMAGLEEFTKLSKKEQEKYIGNDASKRQAADNLKQELDDIRKGAARYKITAGETGTDRDALTRQLGIHFDPSTETGRANVAAFEAGRKEKEAETAERKRFGEGQLQKERVASEEGRRLAEDGDVGFMPRAGAGAMRGIAYYTGQSPEAMRTASVAGQFAGEGLSSPEKFLEHADYWLSKTTKPIGDAMGWEMDDAPRRRMEEMDERMRKALIESTKTDDMLNTLKEIQKNTADKNVRVDRGGDGSRLPGVAAPGLGDK